MRIIILLNYFNEIYISIIFLTAGKLLFDDRGTKPEDSRNELNLQTFFVMNKIDGSSGEGGVVLMFLGLAFSSSSLSDLSSQDLFSCLGHIVMALVELLLRSKMSFHQALDSIFKLNETTIECTRDMWRQSDCLDEFSEVSWLTTGRLMDGSSCGGIGIVREDLDKKPKIDAMMIDFLE
uniref:Uncharacterized protein n=1 Tax=Tanacetum cinerariifolium TaxID=118510 RepID=A0A699KFQ2_TANCI|nr:hypothetical protein [Tanacetum cinerariifolium]